MIKLDESRWNHFGAGLEIVLQPFTSVKLIFGFAVIAMLGTSTIPAVAAGPGWTSNSTVTKLVITADGGVNVLLSPQLSGCVSQSGYGPNFASIYPTHPGVNRMKADLLVAYLNGTSVALYFTDNTCKVGEMILGGW